MEIVEHKIIARIFTDLPEKFGVPRQSGLVENLCGRIVFDPDFRNPDAVRGLEHFSHLWIIWDFSLAHREEWSPTVRPPRLGGNNRVGVFASRSPFRPNSIGLSAVKIVKVEPETPEGPVIYVKGVDMIDNTPIFDIKPYLPYSDSKTDATGGFTDSEKFSRLNVVISPGVTHNLDDNHLSTLTEILANDPRPQYHDDPTRVYGMTFAGHEVKFSVADNTLTVNNIIINKIDSSK